MDSTPTPTSTPIPSDPVAAWPADWSQFVPDLLSGLIVSALVGVALAAYIRHREKRDADRASARIASASWRFAKPLLVDATYDSLVEPDTGFSELFDRVEKLSKAIAQLPVGEWLAAVERTAEGRDARAILARLEELASLKPEIIEALRRLSDKIDAATARHNSHDVNLWDMAYRFALSRDAADLSDMRSTPDRQERAERLLELEDIAPLVAQVRGIVAVYDSKYERYD